MDILLSFGVLDGQKQEKNFAVANLKRAVKCSLAHLVDINLTGK